MISVLLPIYQARTTLATALRSLAWQSCQTWEAVLVDDGSHDGSLELAREWAARDGRFRIVARPHEGLVAALQAGLEECRGSLIARMDADDVAHPRRLELQRRALEEQPSWALVGSKVRLFPAAAVKSGFRRYQGWVNSLLTHQQMTREIFVESPLVHPSVMIRRAWLERVGGYRQGHGPEDYDLWLRLWEAGAELGKLDQVLLYWRESGNRLTRVDESYSSQSIRDLKAQTLVRTYLREGREVVIWGAGDDGKRLARALRAQGVRVEAFADLRRGRIGQRIDGSLVFSPREAFPEGLLRGCFHLAAVGRDGGRAEVRREMEAWGLVETRDYLCVA